MSFWKRPKLLTRPAWGKARCVARWGPVLHMDPAKQTQALLLSQEVRGVLTTRRLQKLLLQLGQSELLDVDPGLLGVLDGDAFGSHFGHQRPVRGGKRGDGFCGGPFQRLVKLVPKILLLLCTQTSLHAKPNHGRPSHHQLLHPKRIVRGLLPRSPLACEPGRQWQTFRGEA